MELDSYGILCTRIDASGCLSARLVCGTRQAGNSSEKCMGGYSVLFGTSLDRKYIRGATYRQFWKLGMARTISVPRVNFMYVVNIVHSDEYSWMAEDKCVESKGSRY
jgi:hypothetical protein